MGGGEAAKEVVAAHSQRFISVPRDRWRMWGMGWKAEGPTSIPSPLSPYPQTFMFNHHCSAQPLQVGH